MYHREPWSCGYAGTEEKGRIVRALVWVRVGDPFDNGESCPSASSAISPPMSL